MELEEAIKKLKTLNQERYNQDTILSLYRNFIDEDEENQPYILTPFERDAIGVVLNYIAKQEKMIDIIIKHICDIIDNDDNASLLPFYNSDDNIEEKVRQYFEKKAEEN